MEEGLERTRGYRGGRKGRLFLGVRGVLADLLLDHVLAVESELSLLRAHPIRLLDTEVLEEKLGAVL